MHIGHLFCHDFFLFIAADGGVQFLTPGNATFIVPADVYLVSVVLVGGGGGGSIPNTSGFDNVAGGAGGGLAWANDIAVIPG